jgi:hypothetical protein
MGAKEDYLKANGIKELSPPATPPQEKPLISSSVAEMREKLEIKKLEMELSKLEKPDTSVDYYSKMLELQQQHFTQLLQMTTAQNDLKLEIEKLKLLGNGEDDSMLPYLQMLAPLIPAILKKDSGTKKEGVVATATAPPQTQETQEEVTEMTAPTTLGELEEYKAAIRRGEISLEEAYSDFLATPWRSSMTQEEFKIKFEELRKTI